MACRKKWRSTVYRCYIECIDEQLHSAEENSFEFKPAPGDHTDCKHPKGIIHAHNLSEWHHIDCIYYDPLEEKIKPFPREVL
jgi:hypothetical protein